MKKWVQSILIVCLAVSTLLLGILLRAEKNNKEDLLLLAQSGAKEAYHQFTDYQQSGEESDYWYAVAAFRSFEQAYCLMTENTNKSTNYTICNEVYGALVLHPENCREHMTDIIAIMRILAQNVENENGYVQMLALRNTLKYE